MHRRNPPAGVAHFSTLTVGDLTTHNLTAGVDDGEFDDNAEHRLHGTTTVSGAEDTLVLQVEQRAEVMDLLSARRLAIGLTTAPDPASDDPYRASGSDDTPYPALDENGSAAAPQKTGFTVDEGGNVRASGFVVVKQAQEGVVLRAPDGRYYAFTVDALGRLSTTGRLVGQTPP